VQTERNEKHVSQARPTWEAAVAAVELDTGIVKDYITLLVSRKGRRKSKVKRESRVHWKNNASRQRRHTVDSGVASSRA
jgi:hypothetical protein